MLEQATAKNKGYITLKEAAAFSNYTPDYIGQLIRAGKIEGEQVYANVAWVTTEASVRDYMDAKRKSAHIPADSRGNSREAFENFATYLWYVLMATTLITFLLVFYIFSVSLDRHLTSTYAERTMPTPEEMGLVTIYD